MQKRLINLFAAILFSAISSIAVAQTTVTFNVNLKPQLEDSTFIPGRDIAGVIGNLHPFQFNAPIKMTDEEPIDSIFTVTVDFPAYQTGKSLQFRYILQTEDEDLRELRPRSIGLKKGKTNLDALFFNTYAF